MNAIHLSFNKQSIKIAGKERCGLSAPKQFNPQNCGDLIGTISVRSIHPTNNNKNKNLN